MIFSYFSYYGGDWESWYYSNRAEIAALDNNVFMTFLICLKQTGVLPKGRFMFDYVLNRVGRSDKFINVGRTDYD